MALNVGSRPRAHEILASIGAGGMARSTRRATAASTASSAIKVRRRTSRSNPDPGRASEREARPCRVSPAHRSPYDVGRRGPGGSVDSRPGVPGRTRGGAPRTRSAADAGAAAHRHARRRRPRQGAPPGGGPPQISSRQIIRPRAVRAARTRPAKERRSARGDRFDTGEPRRGRSRRKAPSSATYSIHGAERSRARGDARADIFAFGTVSRDATGRASFRGKDAGHGIAAILAAEPQPITALRRRPRRARSRHPHLPRKESGRALQSADLLLQLRFIAVDSSTRRRRSRRRAGDWGQPASRVGVAALSLVVAAASVAMLMRAPGHAAGSRCCAPSSCRRRSGPRRHRRFCRPASSRPKRNAGRLRGPRRRESSRSGCAPYGWRRIASTTRGSSFQFLVRRQPADRVLRRGQGQAVRPPAARRRS